MQHVNASRHSEFKCSPTHVTIIYKNTTTGWAKLINSFICHWWAKNQGQVEKSLTVNISSIAFISPQISNSKYLVQNCKVYYGLYPSSGICKTKNHVSETGSVSVLRWTRQDQWLRLALSNGPNSVGLSCPIHLRTGTDPVSKTLWFFVLYIPEDGESPYKPYSSVQHMPSSESFQV
jgi:hypothetical protein